MKKPAVLAILAGAALSATLFACQLIIGLSDPETDPRKDAATADASDAGAIANADGSPVDPCAHVAPFTTDGSDDDPNGDVGPITLAFHLTSLTQRLGYDAGVFDGGPPLSPLLGFDLDHACTCQVDSNGGKNGCVSATAACDGDGGVDDGVSATFTSLALAFPGKTVDQMADIDHRIADGDTTLLVTILNYNGRANDSDIIISVSLGTRPDSDPAPGCVTDAGTRPSSDDGGTFGPAWDGCDRWHPTAFPAVASHGYVVNHAFVTTVTALPIPLGGATISITTTFVQGVLIPTPDGHWSVQDALLTGRAQGDDFLAAFVTFSPMGSTPACFNPDLTAAARSFLCSGRDIMASPSADFRGYSCDAISVALAYRADPAIIGDYMDSGVTLSDCTDSGALLYCPDGGM